MTETTVVQLIREMGEVVLTLAGPLLLAGLVIGLLISVIQVVTSIQDPTLSFVPRILVVMMVGLFLLSWMIEKLVTYTVELFSQLAIYAR